MAIEHPSYCDPRLCTVHSGHYAEHRSAPMEWTPNGDDTSVSVGLVRIDGLDVPYTGDPKVTLRITTEDGEDGITHLTGTDARMLAAALVCAAERAEQLRARAAQ
jgi:hypothetical protein